ncbi:hypothetical protein ITJ55_13865 [Frigoribacterium sp. VKM Ac-1396]|uniref:hypothetical protein n=1 Tax=Frigoribacterium sp. VKM Ac-1396 TaxID=2783821 RepID=UPI00188CD5CB|nr:hypothetical protein [Frigoribacterium sp. VKM Ac-1396]MBF4601898.1 hypothetical protein [Frigoribacterium sp. VKM Ac-1396]
MSDAPELPAAATLAATLAEMNRLYSENPKRAVRGQHFIKALHGHIAYQLNERLHPSARAAGVYIKEEAAILGSHKSKDVDVAVMHPTSGPLLLVGVRSQMSSVGKNVLTYYQDIVGEAVSLQERYPMTIHSYVYLHPLTYQEEKEATSTLPARTATLDTNVDRYAKMYRAITGRDDKFYRVLSGIYDQFAYLVVDFTKSPAELRDDLVVQAVPDTDLSIATFVERLVATYKRRNIWLDLFI